MKGIKRHTHNEREIIVQELVPLIKKKFAKNFVALAADGSFARKEDVDYSDLELIVFVKKIPKKVNWNIGKIVDGQLIEIVVDTKESFIQKYLDISDVWYASGTGRLLPIINKDFIIEINNFKPKDIEKKTQEQIQKRWNRFQEITAKLLNNLTQKNTDGIPLILSDMYKELLVLLSYLNQKPYKTLGKYITSAKKFSKKPEGFDELTKAFINADYSDTNYLKELTKKVFSSFETMLGNKQLLTYLKNHKEIFL